MLLLLLFVTDSALLNLKQSRLLEHAPLSSLQSKAASSHRTDIRKGDRTGKRRTNDRTAKIAGNTVAGLHRRPVRAGTLATLAYRSGQESSQA